jgi:hypothetical protein
MGDEDMFHPLLPPEVGQKPERTGIDRHLVIDEKRDKKLQCRRRQARVQQFDTHG